MKTINTVSLRLCTFIFVLLLAVSQGCKKNADLTQANSSGSFSTDARAMFNAHASFTEVNLVTDIALAKYPAPLLDPNLNNGWGMSFGPSGGIWVSSIGRGVSVIYTKDGQTLHSPVHIPFAGIPPFGLVTGQVINPTNVFKLPGGTASHFIFVTVQGTIAAWASGDTAVTVANRTSAGAAYTGVEIAMNAGSWQLYATDFHNAKIDVFDANFNYLGSSSFSDPSIPSGYAPFNVRLLAGKLFVTYAKQLAPDNEFDDPGPGHGYVDIYNTDGSLDKQLVAQGNLNSPWGLEIFKGNNGLGHHPILERETLSAATAILVGNLGDGYINVYDYSGNYLGKMMNGSHPIQIDGLWAISYPPNEPAYKDVRNRLYFTAGPSDEQNGLFGYIVRTDETEAMTEN